MRIVRGLIILTVLSLGATLGLAAQEKATAPVTKPAGLEIMLMQPTRPKAGDNQFEVMVKGPDGKPLADAEVSVIFVMPAMPAMKMAEMRNEVKLKSAGASRYTGTGKVMMAGTWTVTVSVKQKGKEVGQKKVELTAN
jgi:uncharacterized GH25 family protein